jgi:hypothetical protein
MRALFVVGDWYDARSHTRQTLNQLGTSCRCPKIFDSGESAKETRWPGGPGNSADRQEARLSCTWAEIVIEAGKSDNAFFR